jgi:hypothetical protein
MWASKHCVRIFLDQTKDMERKQENMALESFLIKPEIWNASKQAL